MPVVVRGDGIRSSVREQRTGRIIIHMSGVEPFEVCLGALTLSDADSWLREFIIRPLEILKGDFN